jgi:hypothetical protein
MRCLAQVQSIALDRVSTIPPKHFRARIPIRENFQGISLMGPTSLTSKLDALEISQSDIGLQCLLLYGYLQQPWPTQSLRMEA